MSEIWKPVVGYEGWYEVSNLGNVRSVDRVVSQPSRYGHNIDRILKGKVMTPTDNGNGYLAVGLSKNQKRIQCFVHRLVAIAFVENPKNLPVVNHLDYDKTNNRADNLEWVEQKDNVQYSLQNMLKPHNNKLPKSGERYISKKKGRWRVNIQRIGLSFDKSYATLDEAIAAREVVMNGRQYLAG